MSAFKFSVEDAANALAKSEKKFVQLFEHGTMKLEYYEPEKLDFQTPHVQDELYVVIGGSGQFVRDAETVSFTAGDVLFVPAGIPHRFKNFSDDFSTWVIFYGNTSGEKSDV